MLQGVDVRLPVRQSRFKGKQLLQVMNARQVHARVTHQLRSDDLQGKAVNAARLGKSLGLRRFRLEHFAHGGGNGHAGDVVEHRCTAMGEAHQAGQHGFGRGLAAHPVHGFLVFGCVEAQLQGKEVGPRSQFFLGLEVLRTAFFLVVLERVQRRAQQPVRAGLAGNLQRGHRLQVAHRALAGFMPRQTVTGQQQQLVEAGRLHALQLREQVVAFAVLAGEMRQGRHRAVERGQGVQRRHVQRAADAVADGHGHWPAAQLRTVHDRLHRSEAFCRGFGHKLHDTDEMVFTQRGFQQAHEAGHLVWSGWHCAAEGAGGHVRMRRLVL